MNPRILAVINRLVFPLSILGSRLCNLVHLAQNLDKFVNLVLYVAPPVGFFQCEKATIIVILRACRLEAPTEIQGCEYVMESELSTKSKEAKCV